MVSSVVGAFCWRELSAVEAARLLEAGVGQGRPWFAQQLGKENRTLLCRGIPSCRSALAGGHSQGLRCCKQL